MSLLLAIAAAITVTVVCFAGALTIVVSRDRRRRRQSRRLIPVMLAPDAAQSTELTEEDAAAEFVQLWMDNEWDQRFG